MLLNSFLTLCCLGVTSNMVAAITLNAPTTDVNMTAFLESVETDEAGGKHLWFNYVWAIGSGNSYSRCGEVDAAQRMPAELFQLKNIGKLAQYASLTTQLYTVTGMNPGTKLQLGRCSSRGYTQKQSAMDGVGWAPSELMGPICLKQCDCTSTSAGRYNDDDPPYCEDAPDDPKSGKFCSLCGPKYNSYIKIQLYNKGNDQENAPTTDVNMTAFLKNVETDEAGGKHLWFNYVWAIGSGNSYSRCGEVDAAQRMPAELFQLKNIGKLAQYASLTTQLYTVTGMNPGTKLQLGRCSSRGYTQKQSAMDGVGWAPSELMGPICLKQCDCTSTSAGRYNDDDPPYCEDAPDDPKSGKFCSLCGPKYNSYIKIQLYNKGNDQEKTSSTDNAVEDKSKHKNKNKNKKDNEDGTMNQAADSASTVQSGLVLATACLMAALAMVV